MPLVYDLCLWKGTIWRLHYIFLHQLCFKLLALCTSNLKYNSKGLCVGTSSLVFSTNISMSYSPQLKHEPPIHFPLPLNYFLSWINWFNHTFFPGCITFCWGITLRSPYLLRSQRYGHDGSKEPRSLEQRAGWRGALHGNMKWKVAHRREWDATTSPDSQSKLWCNCEWLSVLPKALLFLAIYIRSMVPCFSFNRCHQNKPRFACFSFLYFLSVCMFLFSWKSCLMNS